MQCESVYIKFHLEYNVFVKFHGNYSRKIYFSYLCWLLILHYYCSTYAYYVNQNYLTIISYSSSYSWEPIIGLTQYINTHRWPMKMTGREKTSWNLGTLSNTEWVLICIFRKTNFIFVLETKAIYQNYFCLFQSVLFFKIYAGFYYNTNHTDMNFHLPKLPIRKYSHILHHLAIIR